MRHTILLTVLLVLLILLWWVHETHNLPGYFLPDPDIASKLVKS